MGVPTKILGIAVTVLLLFGVPFDNGQPIFTIQGFFTPVIEDEWKMWFVLFFMFYGVLALLFPEDR